MPWRTTTSPGPLTRQKRPSMNTTPRSYSRRMRRLDTASTMTTNTMVMPLNSNMIVLLVRGHVEDQVVPRAHPHRAAALQRHAAAHPPLLAVDARPAFVLHVVEDFAGRADQFLGAGHHGAPARAQRHAGDEKAEQRAGCGDREDQRPRQA